MSKLSKDKFLYEERPYIYIGAGILSVLYGKRYVAHLPLPFKLFYYSGVLLICVGILVLTLRLHYRLRGEKLTKKHGHLSKEINDGYNKKID